MKKYIPRSVFLVVPLLVSYWSYSQSTFQKVLPNAANSLGQIAQRSLSGTTVLTTWTSDRFGISGWDIMLVALNEQGDTLWTKVYGTPYDDRSFSLLLTSDGGYLIAGCTDSSANPNGHRSMYLIKTDELGDTLWTRAYARSAKEVGFAVIECLGGGFLVVGSSGVSGLYMTRTDFEGDLLWSKYYDRHDPPEFDSQISALSVCQAADSSFLVTGGRSSHSGSFLSKIATDGTMLWTQIHDTGDGLDTYQVQSTPDGGLILVGSVESPNVDCALIKVDLLGTTAWAKAYGTDAVDVAYSVITTSDGGFAVTGVVNFVGAGSGDMYLIRTNGAGDVLYSTAFGDTLADAGRGLVETNDGGLLVVGLTQSFAPDLSVYLIKTDSNQTGGCHQDSVLSNVTDVVVDWWGLELQSFASNVIQYRSACAVGSGADILSLCPVGIGETLSRAAPIGLFPNPATAGFNVSIASDYDQAQIEIFNSLGERVYNAKVERSETWIDRGPFASGVYLVKVTTGRSPVFLKVVLD